MLSKDRSSVVQDPDEIRKSTEYEIRVLFPHGDVLIPLAQVIELTADGDNYPTTVPNGIQVVVRFKLSTTRYGNNLINVAPYLRPLIDVTETILPST